MEELMRTIDTAIESNDYATIVSVFAVSDDMGKSWHRVGQGEKRSLAAYFIQSAVASPTFLPAAFEHTENVMLTVLGHLPATVENAADNKLRQLLFDYKINDDQDYIAAARVLGGMRMEDDKASVYYVDPHKKADIYVKIAECFLAEDEIAEADAAVNKAGAVVSQLSGAEAARRASGAPGGTSTVATLKERKALLLRYKSTYARVLDANRKFLQAAQRYHELSQTSEDIIDSDELLHMLGRAATCAILAPSGPQRQRVLGQIYKDDRLSSLDQIPEFSTHSTILKKMYYHQVLRPNELTQFESSLAEHQKAIMGDGLTIMERGVVEHNMIAVSNLYRSIYTKELASILGVDQYKAEKIAAAMIMDGTVHGSIDQVEGLLKFEAGENQQTSFDHAISSFCVELNHVTNAVKAETQ